MKHGRFVNNKSVELSRPLIYKVKINLKAICVVMDFGIC